VGSLNLLTNMAAAALLCHGIRSTSRKLLSDYGNREKPDRRRYLASFPARFEHINRLGRYTFQPTEELRNVKLQPLRRN
jgi:hypothetical protein